MFDRNVEAFVVCCESCHPHGSSRPLTIKELCADCAQDTADAHRQLGHHVTVRVIGETPPRRRDQRTQRLLRKAGW